MVAWVEIAPLSERALEVPGALLVLERTAKEMLGLRKPNLSCISRKGEDSLKNAADALINAGYIAAHDRGKSGSDTVISLTDAGWTALGQERPIWM